MAKRKELPPGEKLVQLQTDFIDERRNWEFIHQHGCFDPFWPDGTNLNLIRNHCIFYKQEMERICKEYSLPMPETLPIPDEVSEDYMAPYGRFPNRLMKSKPDESFQLSLELF